MTVIPSADRSNEDHSGTTPRRFAAWNPEKYSVSPTRAVTIPAVFGVMTMLPGGGVGGRRRRSCGGRLRPEEVGEACGRAEAEDYVEGLDLERRLRHGLSDRDAV